MGYDVTNIISIGWTPKYDTREKVNIAINTIIENNDYDAKRTVCLDSQLSNELIASKGGVFVIAGTFNYWVHDAFDFAQRISEELDTHVSITQWDHEAQYIECRAYICGKDINEKPRYVRVNDTDCIRIMGGLNNDEEIRVPAHPDTIVSDPYDPS